MHPEEPASHSIWDERSSQTFIDYGRFFVPERERQFQIIVDLVPRFTQPKITELCCGEGLLAQMLLEQIPACSVYGFDGSVEMLQRAKERLAQFGERFQAKLFDLYAKSWRKPGHPVHTVVSSLAIHHLNAAQKQELFHDVYNMLLPWGSFIIADIIEPAHPIGRELAANAWDEAVRQRALELDGTSDGFDFFERERWNTYWYFDPRDIDKPSRLLDQLKWLEVAGFIDIDLHWMSAGHAIFSGWKYGP